MNGLEVQKITILRFSERWNIISNIYLENTDNIILIKYEDFLLDKNKTIQMLAEKLNLKKEKRDFTFTRKSIPTKRKKKRCGYKSVL